MSEWYERLDLPNPRTPGIARHMSTNGEFGASTLYANDTQAWETMFVSCKDEFWLLQTYKNADDARVGHIYWVNKLKEGFLPTGHLEDNFTLEACLRFLSSLASYAKKEPSNE